MNFKFGIYETNISCDDPSKHRVHSWIKFDTTNLAQNYPGRKGRVLLFWLFC